MPKERAAKLNGEGEKRTRQAASIEDALNRYKKAIEAEAQAKKRYTDHLKHIEGDPYMCGQDYFRAGMDAAEYGNAWEKAAHRYVSSIWFGHHAVFSAFDFCIQYRGATYTLLVTIWNED